ncbi:hypothetical protein [Flavobacterium praedii]|jgi:hypothetical protein|uniref:hypothetical protein n=1 Tax=Flavobacterium praedii TaxID=3002900 RepID=UPI002481C560|nr:hypothetical protein [Flavobacterium praedii]
MKKLSQKQRIENLKEQINDLVLMIEVLETQNNQLRLEQKPKTPFDFPISKLHETRIYHTL